MHYGRLQSYASADSYGFLVKTPSICVEDLGTDFGIDISTQGDAEIHVFRGEAELSEFVDTTSTRFASMLSSGEAMRIHESGYRTNFEASRAAFADWAEIEDRSLSYVSDLRKQLTSLQRENARLAKEEQTTKAELLRSRTLKKLLKQIQTAEQKIAELKKRSEALTTAKQLDEKLGDKLSDLLRREIRKTKDGREICAQIDEVEKEIEQLPSDKDEPKQIRVLQKRRLALQRDLKKRTGRLLKENERLRELSSQQKQNRREMRKVMSKSDFLALENNSQARGKRTLPLNTKRGQTMIACAKLNANGRRWRNRWNTFVN